MKTRAMRTSHIDPLRIDEVAAGNAGGAIGLTFCPGKQGDSMTGGQVGHFYSDEAGQFYIGANIY